MKITESKLRKMIREVIKEFTGTGGLRGAPKKGHKTTEKGVRAEPVVQQKGGGSTILPVSPGSVGQPAKFKGTRTFRGTTNTRYTHNPSTQDPGKSYAWTANPDYKAWEKEMRDAREKDSKPPRPQKQKSPTGGTPGGRSGKGRGKGKGKKGKGKKGKDDE